MRASRPRPWPASPPPARKWHRKKPKGRAMPETMRRANNAKSKIRSRVEHVFAEQKDRMGLFIRTIGIARATAKSLGRRNRDASTHPMSADFLSTRIWRGNCGMLAERERPASAAAPLDFQSCAAGERSDRQQVSAQGLGARALGGSVSRIFQTPPDERSSR